MDSRRAIAIALIIALIANLVLLAIGKISELNFWLVLAAIGIATVLYKRKYVVSKG